MYASLASAAAAKCRLVEAELSVVRQWFEDWQEGLDMPEQLLYNAQREFSEFLEDLKNAKKNEK